MTDSAGITTDERGYGRLARFTGWAIALAYFTHSWLTIVKARTDRALPLREELRGWHYVVGTVLLVLAAIRLWRWFAERDTRPPEGVGAAAHRWSRQIAFVVYALIFVAPFLGLLQGWAGGMPLHLGPVPLPPLVPEERVIWQFSGYFHSGMGFMILLLNVVALLTATYTMLRYGKGLIAVMPPGFGAQVFLSAGATVYAMSTFTSPEPGPTAVATYVAVCAAIWALGWLIHRRRTPARRDANAGWTTTAAGAVVLFAVVAFGATGPFLQFKVTPWPMGEAVETDTDVVWHTEFATTVSLEPETAYEREVRAELFKWCVFCHAMEKGDAEFKVGPNLHAIFGQRAATVPNFHYSRALAERGREGLVWNDETIAAYIANPQSYVPGTHMIISSGPIPDPKTQQAIVNILKRVTMQGAIEGGRSAAEDADRPQAEARAVSTRTEPSGATDDAAAP